MSAISATRGIFVNDRPHALAGAATLMALLGELGLADPGTREIADVAVLVIRATQGG